MQSALLGSQMTAEPAWLCEDLLEGGDTAVGTGIRGRDLEGKAREAGRGQAPLLAEFCQVVNKLSVSQTGLKLTV